MTTMTTYLSRQHEVLASLAGNWEGQTTLWMKPTSTPQVDAVTATIHMAAGGHALVYEYQGSHGDDRADGVMLISQDEESGRQIVSWVNSFHTGTSTMTSTGHTSADALVDVATTYAKEWGWRTTLQPEGADGLVVRMYNIYPSGESYVAVETKLRRI